MVWRTARIERALLANLRPRVAPPKRGKIRVGMLNGRR